MGRARQVTSASPKFSIRHIDDPEKIARKEAAVANQVRRRVKRKICFALMIHYVPSLWHFPNENGPTLAVKYRMVQFRGLQILICILFINVVTLNNALASCEDGLKVENGKHSRQQHGIESNTLAKLSIEEGANWLLQFKLTELVDFAKVGYSAIVEKFPDASSLEKKAIYEKINLQLYRALILHSDDWESRAQAFRNLDQFEISAFDQRGDDPNLGDALLGFDSFAQLNDEKLLIGRPLPRHGEFGPPIAPEVSESEHTWFGGSPWIGYSVLSRRSFQLEFKSQTKVIDLGAGTGRVGMYLMAVLPDVHFVGYEFVRSRVDRAQDWAKRMGLNSHFTMIHQDLADANFILPAADVVFMYAPFSRQTTPKIIDKIIAMAIRPVTVIYGSGSRDGAHAFAQNPHIKF